MYTKPLGSAMSVRLYWSMISWGMSRKCIRMYSYLSRGVLRYMLEMSIPIHFAPGVKRTLFQWILTVSNPAVSVLTSPG